MSNATGTPNATGTNANATGTNGEAGELLTAPWWVVERDFFDDERASVTLLVLLLLWAALTFVGTVMCLPAPSLIASPPAARHVPQPCRPLSDRYPHLESSGTATSSSPASILPPR